MCPCMTHHTTDADEESDYTVDHRLSDKEANIHRAWDNSLDPVLEVEDGDVVRFECRDAVAARSTSSQASTTSRTSASTRFTP